MMYTVILDGRTPGGSWFGKYGWDPWISRVCKGWMWTWVEGWIFIRIPDTFSWGFFGSLFLLLPYSCFLFFKIGWWWWWWRWRWWSFIYLLGENICLSKLNCRVLGAKIKLKNLWNSRWSHFPMFALYNCDWKWWGMASVSLQRGVGFNRGAFKESLYCSLLTGCPCFLLSNWWSFQSYSNLFCITVRRVSFITQNIVNKQARAIFFLMDWFSFIHSICIAAHQLFPEKAFCSTMKFTFVKIFKL